MTKNEWRLFFALNDKLIALLDRHVAIYFEERPWIETPKVKHIVTSEELLKNNMLGNWYWVNAPHNFIDKSKETKQVELEIKTVSAKIDELLNPKEPVSDTVIQSIFGS